MTDQTKDVMIRRVYRAIEELEKRIDPTDIGDNEAFKIAGIARGALVTWIDESREKDDD